MEQGKLQPAHNEDTSCACHRTAVVAAVVAEIEQPVHAARASTDDACDQCLHKPQQVPQIIIISIYMLTVIPPQMEVRPG